MIIETCTFTDVLAARPRVYRHLAPTPLHFYPGLSDLLDAEVHVKHENHQPIGAFKVRGGVNLAETLDSDARSAGLYTASTGNHGQSIAYAGKVSGVPVRVALPVGANPTKAAAIRGLGAEVIEHGRDFDEAREWIMAQARNDGARFIGPTDPELIAGVGTYGLEIMEVLPNVDVIVVPVGAGSGASATALVARTMSPTVRVVAVQAERAPAIHQSWSSGQLCTSTMETMAEGLATRVAFQNTLNMLRDGSTGIHDFLLVSDEALGAAVKLLLEHTRNMAELAGAAGLAGALQIKDQLVGQRVAVVLSGGNLSMDKLKGILA
jgi:threonine dehydratase